MGSDYIDLVLCDYSPTRRVGLFWATVGSVSRGESVLVKAGGEERESEAVNVYTVRKGSDEEAFIAQAAGAEFPLPRVIGKVTRQYFEIPVQAIPGEEEPTDGSV